MGGYARTNIVNKVLQTVCFGPQILYMIAVGTLPEIENKKTGIHRLISV